jgi:hypothetical protein
VRLEHLGHPHLLQPWQDSLDSNKTLRLRTGKAGGVNNREGEAVEAEDADAVVPQIHTGFRPNLKFITNRRFYLHHNHLHLLLRQDQWV